MLLIVHPSDHGIENTYTFERVRGQFSMSKPILKVGSKGLFVEEAQTKLNVHSPTKYQRLVPDGQFGFLTDRRVKEFKSQQGLDAKTSTIDASVWEALDNKPTKGPPTVPLTPPITTPPQIGNRRANIINRAKAQKGAVDYAKRTSAGPHGWEHLGTILREGGDLEVSEFELRKTWQPHGIKWCSIFAVYCYRLAGASARWGRFSGGRLFGEIKIHHRHQFASATAFAESIRPADICLLHGGESHHVICTSINQDHSAMRTMEGNLEFGRISDRIRKLKDVIAYYSLPN